MKLTEAELGLLRRAAFGSLIDMSGAGAIILDGVQARTAERLSAKGLIERTLPHSGSTHGFARITEAGRAALSEEKRNG